MHHLPPWPVPTDTWEAPAVPTSMHTDPHKYACCPQPGQANRTCKMGVMHNMAVDDMEQAGGHLG